MTGRTLDDTPRTHLSGPVPDPSATPVARVAAAPEAPEAGPPAPAAPETSAPEASAPAPAAPGPVAPAVGSTGSHPLAESPWDPASPPQPTSPVPGPPPRRGASVQPRTPRVRMGPWAPVAGAGLGLLVGLLVTFLGLAPGTQVYVQRLASVFLCLGFVLLGAGGVLFADEIRVRRRSVSTQSAEVVAGLVNGLTPARFLVGAAGFVLLLAAYVAHG